MTISSIKSQFTVNSVLFQEDTETRLNIKKRRERVVYRTLSNKDNINVAYLTGESITPTNNLFISDRSTTLTQNRIPSGSSITTVTGKTFSVSVDKFLLTDVFTEETPSAPSIPLFYAHTLKNFNDSLDDFSDLSLLSIEFADYTLNSFNFNTYVLDTTTGTVYNNIENTYDDNDQSFDVTYIKYTVRKGSGSAQVVSVYHELVDNKPVYEQADFDDLDYTGVSVVLKTDGRKKYLVELQPGLGTYLVTLPTLAQYAYRERPQSRIRVLSPTAINLSVPWHVRVTNGQFLASLQTAENTFQTFKYRLAEFNDQTFQPFPPYKIQIEQEAVWLHDNLIHVPKHLAVDSELELHIQVIVEDRRGDLKYAFTTNTDIVGNLYQGTTYYTAGIASYDEPNGFIELTNTIRDDDTAFVSYYAQDEEYDFTFVDLNPINNLDILNQRVVLYVAPETNATGTLQNTLHYLIVDTLGKISFSSQAASGATDSATVKMTGEDFFTTGLPKYDFYYDRESTASGIRTTFSESTEEERSEFSFIDKYTVDSVLVNTTSLLVDSPTSGNFTDNTRYLVLADMYVGEGQAPEGLTQFDVRIQGGGIKEDNFEQAIDQQPEVAWYWDFNAGRYYPGAGAFYAEVPQSLLTTYGGRFTEDEIKDVIGRHMKAGGYAKVETYGIDPVITSVATTSGEIALEWPSYGSNATYNVYYSTSQNVRFTTATLAALSDNASGNEYTISGLIASTKYFLKVGALDTDLNESFGPTVSATTLRNIIT